MPTYPIGQNATTARDGEVNVANVVKGHVNGSNVSDEAIIVPSGAVDLPTTADATNPAADHQRLIARTDGLYVRDETGTEVGPLGPSTGHRSRRAPSLRRGSGRVPRRPGRCCTVTVQEVLHGRLPPPEPCRWSPTANTALRCCGPPPQTTAFTPWAA